MYTYKKKKKINCKKFTRGFIYLNVLKNFRSPKRPVINSSLKYLSQIFNWNLIYYSAARTVDFRKIWIYFKVLKYRVFNTIFFNSKKLLTFKNLYHIKDVKTYNQHTPCLRASLKFKYPRLNKIFVKKRKQLIWQSCLLNKQIAKTNYNAFFNKKLFFYNLFLYWYNIKINSWMHIVLNNKLFFWIYLFYANFNFYIFGLFERDCISYYNLSIKSLLHRGSCLTGYLYINAINILSKCLHGFQTPILNKRFVNVWQIHSFLWKKGFKKFYKFYSRRKFLFTRKYYGVSFRKLKKNYFFHSRYTKRRRRYYLRFFLKPYIKIFKFLKIIKNMSKYSNSSYVSNNMDFYKYMLYIIRRKSTLIGSTSKPAALRNRKLKVILLKHPPASRRRKKKIRILFNSLYPIVRNNSHTWTLGLPRFLI